MAFFFNNFNIFKLYIIENESNNNIGQVILKKIKNEKKKIIPKTNFTTCFVLLPTTNSSFPFQSSHWLFLK
jgi:hypothetical protein